MVDLIVPASTLLHIDAGHPIEPRYALFRMESNATIRCDVDLVLRADKAEFEDGCLIDATGQAGAAGQKGHVDSPFGSPFPGGGGDVGSVGGKVTVEAGLAKIGGLTIVTSGGAGGAGGTGVDTFFGDGGNGGPGGRGGNAGQISVTWIRLAAGLPSAEDVVPLGHKYTSAGGPGGPGGPGGVSKEANSQPGLHGANGASGAGLPVQVRWKVNFAGLLWAQIQDMGPSPRSAHDMTYDAVRGRLVLFGGRNDLSALGDTWEWDGQLWCQMADTGPSARHSHAMAFDDARGRVLLFGGQQDDGTLMGDTWAWDGVGWVQFADTGPAPREGHAMSADPGRGRVVLFGGFAFAAAGNTIADDTWEWQQGKWTQVQDVGPSARVGAKLAYDPGSAVNLLFGGSDDDITWAWDGVHWKQVAHMGPAGRSGHALSTTDGGVILFGGIENGSPRNDTWAWFENAWRQIQDIGPAPRLGHAMAYDPARGIIAYGGDTQGILRGDTWQLCQRY